MKDKNLLLEAIDNSLQYSPKQRELLKIFLDLEVDNLVSITPRELTYILKTTRTTVYAALSCFEKEGFIANKTEKGKHFNTYKLNKNNLVKLIPPYLKKKNYLDTK